MTIKRYVYKPHYGLGNVLVQSEDGPLVMYEDLEEVLAERTSTDNAAMKAGVEVAISITFQRTLAAAKECVHDLTLDSEDSDFYMQGVEDAIEAAMADLDQIRLEDIPAIEEVTCNLCHGAGEFVGPIAGDPTEILDCGCGRCGGTGRMQKDQLS